MELKKHNVIKNEPTITTLEVADMMEVSHSDILRKLDGRKDRKGYIEILTESQMALSDFFIPSTYKDSSGKENKCYLVTKLGCDFLANKSTGKKGVLFTAKYVKRFYEMESKIRSSETVGMTNTDVEAIVEKVIEKLSGKTQRDIFIEKKSVYEECSKNLYHAIDAYLIEMRKQELYKNVEAIANYYDFDCSYVLHIAYKELERKLGISLNAYKSVYKSETGKNNVCMVEVIVANDRIYKEAMGLTRYIIEKMEEFE